MFRLIKNENIEKIFTFLQIEDFLQLSKSNKLFYNNEQIKSIYEVYKSLIDENRSKALSILSISYLLSNDYKQIKSYLKNRINFLNPFHQKSLQLVVGMIIGKIYEMIMNGNVNDLSDDTEIIKLIRSIYKSIFKLKSINDDNLISELSPISDEKTKILISNLKGNYSFPSSGLSISSISSIIQSISYHNHIKKLILSNNQLGEVHSNTTSSQISSAFSSLGRSLQIGNLLKVVNLSNNSLSEKHLKGFISYMTYQKSIFLIDLSKNNIGGDNMECLQVLLSKNQCLNTLILSNNVIGPNGMKFISIGMKNNKTLMKLDVSYNGICSKGMEYLSFLSTCQLQSFDISGNYILDQGVVTFSKHIATNSSLSYIFLENNKITAKNMPELSVGLSKCTSLVGIYLNRNEIGDSGAINLYSTLRNTKLYGIEISNNSLGHISMPSLCEFVSKSANLGKIDLSANVLGYKSCLYISNIITSCELLRNLNIKGSQIGYEGLLKLSESLINSFSLKILNLSDNNLNDAIDLLVSIIEKNRSISELDLSENHLTDESFLRIVDVLKSNTTMKKINMQLNKITLKGIEAYKKNSKKNRFVEIELKNNFQQYENKAGSEKKRSLSKRKKKI